MSPTLIVAGGGTGGHVFPGIAVAEAFRALRPGARVSFVGTAAGLEATAVPARGFAFDAVPSGPARGGGLKAARGLARAAVGLGAAFSVIRRRRPDVVLGVGGYASVPVALAAAASGIPLFLQEQNAVPGRANRLLSRLARQVFAGFRGAVPLFPPGKATATGNPVRREVVSAAEAARSAPPTESPFTVLALGGSQGARAINGLVLDLARAARRAGRPARFLLQTGRGEYETVRAAVDGEGLPVEAFPFTDRIGEAFARCHAVLMRAGALSIAEAALFARPCVLVPYPFAADRHQERNAGEFCGTGAGAWFPQEAATAEAVAAVLDGWAGDPARRRAAADAAAAFARPRAAEEIAAALLAGARKGARRV